MKSKLPVIIMLIVIIITLSIKMKDQNDNFRKLEAEYYKSKVDILKLNSELNSLNYTLSKSKSEIESLKKANKKLTDDNVKKVSRSQKPALVFTATAYCPCEICNGKWVGYPTKSGTDYKEGRTIAVDPSVIKLGTKVEINGVKGYVAEDTGSAIKGNKIDIFFNSHEEALKFGRRKVHLRILD